jgi:hypothetical protein
LLWRAAWASIGSVMMRNASAADAAVDACRNDLRDRVEKGRRPISEAPLKNPS